MIFYSWCKLLFLEQKLQFGEFGKYNRYRYLCLKRQPRNTVERLRIAKEVLDGPGVNTMEAQANELYLRNQKANDLGQSIQQVNGQTPTNAIDQTNAVKKGEEVA